MGATRLGKWTLDRELGRGGMGRVFLGQDDSGQLAAIKVLSADLAQDPGFQARFRREIEALAQLDHPNIVRFFEAGVHEATWFYAMEYVEGEDFDELLYEHTRIPWPEVLDAALQICLALKHAHDRGIIHRDLKPPNLLRTREGVVKLTDFGIAKVFSHGQLTTAGGIVGTAEYMSPEQAAGKPVTKRSDLYSLGILLYTLTVGRPPFEGETIVDIMHKHRYAQFDTPIKLMPELPWEIDQVICQLLAKDPADRPQDAMVLHKHLDTIRRKLERRSHHTSAGSTREPTRAENAPSASPGPATLMSKMMREHLEEVKHGGPIARWFNQAYVLLPLFLLVVGVLVWAIWFRPEAAQTEDSSSLDATRLEAALHQGAASLPRQLYQQGLEQVRQGQLDAATATWQNLVQAFDGVPAARRWVSEARSGLEVLSKRESATDQEDPALQAALGRARELRKQGKRQEADKIYRALEELLGNQPRYQKLKDLVRQEKDS